MRHRRFAFVALCALALLVPGMSAIGQGTTITYLTPPWAVPPNAESFAAFQAESGITVEVQSLPSDQLYSRVQVASAGGQEPADVIFLSEEAPSNIVATGNMMPLNAYIDATPDLNIDEIDRLDFWTINGDVYGITSYVQLVMMDYNAERYAQAGVEGLPTTWLDLWNAATALKAEGIDEYPVAMGAIDWSWYLIALSMGDPMFDADLNPVFADEGSKAREAMQYLLDLFASELISPELLSGSTTQHQIFWSGSGTFHQGWQGSVRVGNNPDISQQAPNVAYLPLPEAGNTWSLDAAIGISAASDNPDAAWEFIQWYLGAENQIDIFNAVGLIPSRTSAQQALDDQDLIEGYDVIVDQGTRVTQLPRYALWWGPFTNTVSEMILQAAQSGGMTGDEVIDALADEWNDLKAEYE
jgi:multiple sugar transport system substrate-binding protein